MTVIYAEDILFCVQRQVYTQHQAFDLVCNCVCDAINKASEMDLHEVADVATVGVPHSEKNFERPSSFERLNSPINTSKQAYGISEQN